MNNYPSSMHILTAFAKSGYVSSEDNIKAASAYNARAAMSLLMFEMDSI